MDEIVVHDLLAGDRRRPYQALSFATSPEKTTPAKSMYFWVVLKSAWPASA